MSRLIAVEDIEKLVAAIVADPTSFRGATLELASDEVTGREMEIALTEAAGRPTAYSRTASAFLNEHPQFRKMSELINERPLAGNANDHGEW